MSGRRGGPPEYRDGIITALVSRRGEDGRVVVHLDGRRAFDLSAILAERTGLRVGDLLTAGRQRELYDQDAPFRARERALRVLGVRDRSAREVEMRLRQAGFDTGVVADTIAWLQGLGYLDDRRFATGYAAEKQRTGWGAKRIRAELAGKGVERTVVDEVLARQERAEAAGFGTEPEVGSVDTGRPTGAQDRLEEMVRRRFAGQFATDPRAAERRLAGFLARRGYDWETIARMARDLRAAACETGRDDAQQT